ncbi:MAG: mononuclear molybdenum enzyme YedY, partial [Anaerolineae bacterium]|nr:mononuclear molybdenum enzyme YedY [Anaerolineae bacterium]
MKIPTIPSSEITPEQVYLNRRRFISGLGLVAGSLAMAACVAPETPEGQATATEKVPPVVTPTALPGLPGADAAPSTVSTRDELGDPLTAYEAVTTYNNFYEFGTDKGDP